MTAHNWPAIHCAPFLTRELELLENVKVIVPLGHKAFDAIKKSYASSAQLGKFAHGDGIIEIIRPRGCGDA